MRPIFCWNQTHKSSLTHSQTKAVGPSATVVPESHPSALLRSTQARVSGLLIDQTWAAGPEGERVVLFCSLVPPDEKEAKRTVSFDPAGIKIELLMRVERSGLSVSTSVWYGSGRMQRLGQEVSWNFQLTCCTSLFLIISAIAATTSVQQF